MKTKIFLVIATMLVFGLAIVVYSSSNATDLSANAASCCCCHGDSCPMKAKAADGKEAASCCDNCECCKGDGASCPMMKKDADGKAMKTGDAKSCPMMMKKDATATAATATKTDEAKSCPMMKKDADGNPVKMDAAHASHMKHDMKMEGSGCCCPCCQEKMNKEKTAAPAV